MHFGLDRMDLKWKNERYKRTGEWNEWEELKRGRGSHLYTNYCRIGRILGVNLFEEGLRRGLE